MYSSEATIDKNTRSGQAVSKRDRTSCLFGRRPCACHRWSGLQTGKLLHILLAPDEDLL